MIVSQFRILASSLFGAHHCVQAMYSTVAFNMCAIFAIQDPHITYSLLKNR